MSAHWMAATIRILLRRVETLEAKALERQELALEQLVAPNGRDSKFSSADAPDLKLRHKKEVSWGMVESVDFSGFDRVDAVLGPKLDALELRLDELLARQKESANRCARLEERLPVTCASGENLNPRENPLITDALARAALIDGVWGIGCEEEAVDDDEAAELAGAKWSPPGTGDEASSLTRHRLGFLDDASWGGIRCASSVLLHIEEEWRLDGCREADMDRGSSVEDPPPLDPCARCRRPLGEDCCLWDDDELHRQVWLCAICADLAAEEEDLRFEGT